MGCRNRPRLPRHCHRERRPPLYRTDRLRVRRCNGGIPRSRLHLRIRFRRFLRERGGRRGPGHRRCRGTLVPITAECGRLHTTRLNCLLCRPGGGRVLCLRLILLRGRCLVLLTRNLLNLQDCRIVRRRIPVFRLRIVVVPRLLLLDSHCGHLRGRPQGIVIRNRRRMGMEMPGRHYQQGGFLRRHLRRMLVNLGSRG